MQHHNIQIYFCNIRMKHSQYCSKTFGTPEIYICNMESAHYNTPIRSKATLLGPRRSTHQRPVEQTWRNMDRSLCVRVLKSFFQQSPEQLILRKTYPTSGYNLAHISRHAMLLAGGYFVENSD